MTTITVTFILNFVKKVSKDAGGKKGKKEKKPKKGKKAPETSAPPETEIKEVDPNILTLTVNVKNPLTYVHIEYNLLPGNPVYSIDVLFWGTIAKVYTKDGNKAMRSINKNEHCWITFSIRHKFVLDVNELTNLKTHVVNFSISCSKNKVGPSAKTDPVKMFYFRENDVKLQSVFAEAFNDNPNDSESNLSDFKPENVENVGRIISDLLKFPVRGEILSILNILPDELERKKIDRVIEKFCSGEKIDCINSEEEGINIKELLKEKKSKGKGKGKGKKEKKAKKGKKPSDVLKLSVKAELFFTDPNFPLFDFKTKNADITQAFVTICVKDLMNFNQILELNPVVVKIEKIRNIPADVLEENGYTLLYLTYNVGNEECIINARPLSKEITFKEHHIYFVDKESLNKLSENIQTGFFIVQIHGVRTPSVENSRRIFGENIKDQFLSKNIQNLPEFKNYTVGETENSKKSILLAVSPFKLNSLLNPFWRFCKNGYCFHPDNIYVNTDQELDKFQKITVNSLNITENNCFDKNPLNDGTLLMNETTVKIELQIWRPINKILENMSFNPKFYSRIILVIYNKNLAKHILTNVVRHNAYWIDTDEVLPNYLDKKDEENTAFNYEYIITGFVIDSGNYSLMYFEGAPKWINFIVWKEIKKHSAANLKVYYNSCYIYGERIYSDFFTYGGIYVITLQYSLHDLLKNIKVYLRGFLPEPCRKALKKIDLIMKCGNMKQFNNTLLPSAKELLSLDLEIGVPLHWSVQKR